MKRKLHSLAVRLGTMLLPLKVLRAVYRKPEHIDKLNFTKREADPNRDLANWKPTT